MVGEYRPGSSNETAVSRELQLTVLSTARYFDLCNITSLKATSLCRIDVKYFLYSFLLYISGCLPRNVVIDIVEKYNDACNLGLDMNYARMVTFTPGNVDRSGNVLLKPYLTNLSGGRKRPGDDGTQTRY